MKTKKYPTKLIVGYYIYRITEGESYSAWLSVVVVFVLDDPTTVELLLLLGVKGTVGALLISSCDIVGGRVCSSSNFFSGDGLSFLKKCLHHSLCYLQWCLHLSSNPYHYSCLYPFHEYHNLKQFSTTIVAISAAFTKFTITTTIIAIIAIIISSSTTFLFVFSSGWLNCCTLCCFWLCCSCYCCCLGTAWWCGNCSFYITWRVTVVTAVNCKNNCKNNNSYYYSPWNNVAYKLMLIAPFK